MYQSSLIHLCSISGPVWWTLASGWPWPSWVWSLWLTASWLVCILYCSWSSTRWSGGLLCQQVARRWQARVGGEAVERSAASQSSSLSAAPPWRRRKWWHSQKGGARHSLLTTVQMKYIALTPGTMSKEYLFSTKYFSYYVIFLTQSDFYIRANAKGQ